VTLFLYESAKHVKVQMLHARYFDPKLATSLHQPETDCVVEMYTGF